jgi:SPP1 family predicted phage head-tail adaptor
MIGSMKDRIRVVHINKVSNGRGGFKRSEVEIGTFWGAIEEASGRNIVEYRQAEMKTNTRITVRKDTRITRQCELYSRGMKYEIEEILDEGDYLNILAVGERIGE